MVSLAGEAPKEIDDMASLKSGSSEQSKNKNHTRAPSKNNSNEGDDVVQVAKRPKDKYGFFLRGSLIFQQQQKSK